MSVIAVVDYGVGNVKSIINAFEHVGANVILTRETSVILGADGLVLPGVGAFSHGMASLEQYSLIKPINAFVQSGKPLLGICLGMQMLFSSSDEFGSTKGLDIIPGKVMKFPRENIEYQKLPHVSWNELSEPKVGAWNETILNGINEAEDMYFVHSFIAVPDDKDNILSTTSYSDYIFCSTTKKDNIYGCQFHPETSAESGLKIIRNFKDICGRKYND